MSIEELVIQIAKQVEEIERRLDSPMYGTMIEDKED